MNKRTGRDPGCDEVPPCRRNVLDGAGVAGQGWAHELPRRRSYPHQRRRDAARAPSRRLDALVEQCTDPVSVRWTTVPLGLHPRDGRSYLTESVPAAWQDDSEWNFAIESHPPRRPAAVQRLDLAARRGRPTRRDRVRRPPGGPRPRRDDDGGPTAARLGLRAHATSRPSSGWPNAATSRRGGSRGGPASRSAACVPTWLDHRGEYPDAWIGALHRDDPREPQTTWYDVPTLDRRHDPASPTARGRRRPDRGGVQRRGNGLLAVVHALALHPGRRRRVRHARVRGSRGGTVPPVGGRGSRHRPAPRRRGSAPDQARVGRSGLLDASGRARPWRDDRGRPRPRAARLRRCGWRRARPEKVVHQGGGGQRRIPAGRRDERLHATTAPSGGPRC